VAERTPEEQAAVTRRDFGRDTHERFRVLVERLEELEARVEGLEYLAARALRSGAVQDPASVRVPDAARIVAEERDRLCPAYAEEPS